MQLAACCRPPAAGCWQIEPLAPFCLVQGPMGQMIVPVANEESD